jgi:hypothetical protein
MTERLLAVINQTENVTSFQITHALDGLRKDGWGAPQAPTPLP